MDSAPPAPFTAFGDRELKPAAFEPDMTNPETLFCVSIFEMAYATRSLTEIASASFEHCTVRQSTEILKIAALLSEMIGTVPVDDETPHGHVTAALVAHARISLDMVYEEFLFSLDQARLQDELDPIDQVERAELLSRIALATEIRMWLEAIAPITVKRYEEHEEKCQRSLGSHCICSSGAITQVAQSAYETSMPLMVSLFSRWTELSEGQCITCWADVDCQTPIDSIVSAASSIAEISEIEPADISRMPDEAIRELIQGASNILTRRD